MIISPNSSDTSTPNAATHPTGLSFAVQEKLRAQRLEPDEVVLPDCENLVHRSIVVNGLAQGAGPDQQVNEVLAAHAAGPPLELASIQLLHGHHEHNRRAHGLKHTMVSDVNLHAAQSDASMLAKLRTKVYLPERSTLDKSLFHCSLRGCGKAVVDPRRSNELKRERGAAPFRAVCAFEEAGMLGDGGTQGRPVSR
eukprot:CAMPEP_0114287292 /NCGR_PEP_ID=MMETSP0059-20121206/6201_1 /TAXON_ID=36894 /ORGANISM="Pyramimonas parkeae, Strain CCMP726" /LENGTH=195 /DNA_ID=CAMNT_0001408365 /DNA_START=444 /DNA_END=1032 /DNA_ORIENTATION=+